ncbi:hypothetical protein E2636_11960 [Paenisporosarcina antarctica]|uniref:DUF3955 domain-containing protein n=2 Tax=Paenisporosarcina antarctica TaxID=417367 RepID=A0A4P6ZZD9_9BACL|nr:hypothetical protein E2636_11960 [Paenisporosarcina antarctica]
MKNSGILLVGMSLLTLALVIVLSRVAEAIFVISKVDIGHVTPIFVYVLIGIVFLLGLISILNKQK